MIETNYGEGNRIFYWQCQYCPFKLLSKQFNATTARIHSSGDLHRCSELINQVCMQLPIAVVAQTSVVIKKKKDAHVLKAAYRLHKHELLNATMSDGDITKK